MSNLFRKLPLLVIIALMVVAVVLVVGGPTGLWFSRTEMLVGSLVGGGLLLAGWLGSRAGIKEAEFDNKASDE